MWLSTHRQRDDGTFGQERVNDDELIVSFTHELGHRLLAEYKIFVPLDEPREDYEVHRILYVFLYDTWVAAFGVYRANEMAKHEARSTMPADYRDAWKRAMSLSAPERAKLTRYLVRHKCLPGKKAWTG